MAESGRKLASRRSAWQQVEIFEHPVFGRQLVIDGDLQISESDAAYNTAMTAPLLTLPSCRQVAILGGGDGGVLYELLAQSDRLQRPLDRVTLVDIDETVVQLCQQWMPRLCGQAFDDPRLELRIGDAFAWIDAARDLDAVIYDLTMDPVREGMSRLEFIGGILDKIRASLRPGGVLSLQACGDWLADREQLLGELRDCLDARFRDRQEQVVTVPSYGEQWTFMAAWV